MAERNRVLGWHDPRRAVAQVGPPWLLMRSSSQESSCCVLACCRLLASPHRPPKRFRSTLHSRRLAFGDDHMEELRQKFMAQPEYSDPDKPVQHTATARLVCLRRQQPQAAL